MNLFHVIRHSRDHRWLLLLIVLCAPFLAVLDAFIFNVAVPSIQSTFHTSNAAVQFIIVGYVFSYATLLVTGGRLGDIYGRKKLFILGMFFFSLASEFGAFAVDEKMLIAVRIFQGASAALMYPQALSIMQVNFAGKDRAIALTIFGLTLGLASIVGQLLGGLLIQLNLFHLSWRPIFLINIPLGLTTALLASRFIKESRAEANPKLDIVGVILLTESLLFLIFFLVMGRDFAWPGWLWILLIPTVITGGMFVWYEKRLAGRAELPLINLELLRTKSFVIGLLITIVFYAGQVSFFLPLTLYLQHGLHLSSLVSSLILTPLAIGFFLSSLISHTVVKKVGKHIITLGSTILVYGSVALSLLALNTTQSVSSNIIVLVLFFIGMGYGLIIPSLIGVVLHKVPTLHAGSASGMIVTTQQLAGALGIAVIGIPFFSALGGMHPQYSSAFGHTLYYHTGLFATTGLLVNFLTD